MAREYSVPFQKYPTQYNVHLQPLQPWCIRDMDKKKPEGRASGVDIIQEKPLQRPPAERSNPSPPRANQSSAD